MRRKFFSFILLLTLILFNLQLAEGIEKKALLNLADFAPGKPDTAFKSLGMPFPDDTGGVHYFTKTGSKTELWFYIGSEKGRRKIQWVMLAHKNLSSERLRRNSHGMLSAVNPDLIGAPGGIGIGDSAPAVLKLLGKPSKTEKVNRMDVLIYPAAEGVLKIGIINGRVMSVGLFKGEDE